jgi:hypothetical protein
VNPVSPGRALICTGRGFFHFSDGKQTGWKKSNTAVCRWFAPKKKFSDNFAGLNWCNESLLDALGVFL